MMTVLTVFTIAPPAKRTLACVCTAVLRETGAARLRPTLRLLVLGDSLTAAPWNEELACTLGTRVRPACKRGKIKNDNDQYMWQWRGSGESAADTRTAPTLGATLRVCRPAWAICIFWAIMVAILDRGRDAGI